MLQKTPSLFFLMVVLITGCSLYRSEGRKDFETRSSDPGVIHRALSSSTPTSIENRIESKKVSHLTASTQCRIVNSIDFWIKAEFSPETHELVYSSDTTEIWRTLQIKDSEKTHVDVISQNQAADQMDLEVCSIDFINVANSEAFLEEYIKE